MTRASPGGILTAQRLSLRSCASGSGCSVSGMARESSCVLPQSQQGHSHGSATIPLPNAGAGLQQHQQQQQQGEPCTGLRSLAHQALSPQCLHPLSLGVGIPPLVGMSAHISAGGFSTSRINAPTARSASCLHGHQRSALNRSPSPNSRRTASPHNFSPSRSPMTEVGSGGPHPQRCCSPQRLPSNWRSGALAHHASSPLMGCSPRSAAPSRPASPLSRAAANASAAQSQTIAVPTCSNALRWSPEPPVPEADLLAPPGSHMRLASLSRNSQHEGACATSVSSRPHMPETPPVSKPTLPMSTARRAPLPSKRIVSAPAYPGSMSPRLSEPPWVASLETVRRSREASKRAAELFADMSNDPLTTIIGKIPPQEESQLSYLPSEPTVAEEEQKPPAKTSRADCDRDTENCRPAGQHTSRSPNRDLCKKHRSGGDSTKPSLNANRNSRMDLLLPGRPKRLPVISRDANRRTREAAQGTGGELLAKKTPLSHSCVNLQQKLADIRCTDEEKTPKMTSRQLGVDKAGADVASLYQVSSTPCLTVVRCEI